MQAWHGAQWSLSAASAGQVGDSSSSPRTATSRRARHQVGVLALPAEARRLCHGFSITGAVSTKTFTSWGSVPDEATQRLQLGFITA